jgi:hypothetical protein
MEDISLRWYDIPELVVPIRISLTTDMFHFSLEKYIELETNNVLCCSGYNVPTILLINNIVCHRVIIPLT